MWLTGLLSGDVYSWNEVFTLMSRVCCEKYGLHESIAVLKAIVSFILLRLVHQ